MLSLSQYKRFLSRLKVYPPLPGRSTIKFSKGLQISVFACQNRPKSTILGVIAFTQNGKRRADGRRTPFPAGFRDAPAKPGPSLTEFYQLLQRGLDREGRVFALPALYATFQAPARHIYVDEAADYLTLSETRRRAAPCCSRPGCSKFYTAASRPAGRHPGGSSPSPRSAPLHRLRGAAPAPFVWEDPLPPLPDCAAALTLTLTLRDVEAIDADPPRWPGGSAGSGGQALARPTPRPIPTSPGGLRCSSDCTNVRILLYSFSFYPAIIGAFQPCIR